MKIILKRKDEVKEPNNEIIKLKNELNKANLIIEQQKLIINELQNKLVNYSKIINNYKIKAITEKLDLKKQNVQLNENIQINNNVNFNEVICVNFILTDKDLNFAIPCKINDVFVEVEEKLYKHFPKYRETNNNFYLNGQQILRFKTINSNKIEGDFPIILVVPSKDK